MLKKTEKKWLSVFAGALLINEPIPELFQKGNWLTVDPGNNTAIAQWVDGKFCHVDTYRDCIQNPPDIFISGVSVLIENVELFGYSSISYASASTGDLFKLAFVIGALIVQFRRQENPVYIVSPRRWKGQLDYDQVRHILRHKFLMETNNDHEASADGIGLWALGQF